MHGDLLRSGSVPVALPPALTFLLRGAVVKGGLTPPDQVPVRSLAQVLAMAADKGEQVTCRRPAVGAEAAERCAR
jgi:hypothetical protein